MSFKNKTLGQRRFEELAPTFGIIDFTTFDNTNKYKNKNTAKTFALYNMGKEDQKLGHGSNYIIGKLVMRPTGKSFQFSEFPKVHISPRDAKTEHMRLANAFPGETFVLFSSIRAFKQEKEATEYRPKSIDIISGAAGIIREGPNHGYSDDGFGNLVKVKFHTRLAIYDFIENDINI